MPSTLRVNVFPGGFNWPIFVAQENGYFAREDLAVELQATTGSVAQMTDFAAGRCDIVMTAFDNIVAYVEGEGEAPIGAQPEFFAFLGSDDSFLSLVGAPGISKVADLRGRSVSVDAATTGQGEQTQLALAGLVAQVFQHRLRVAAGQPFGLGHGRPSAVIRVDSRSLRRRRAAAVARTRRPGGTSTATGGRPAPSAAGP